MSYKLNRGPKIVAACLGAVALFAGARYATTHGLLTPPAAESKVPERASLPALNEAEAAPAATCESRCRGASRAVPTCPSCAR
jgi:hypothetical protein